MLKTLGALTLLGICVVAAVGLAGGGPVWFRYVGSSIEILLLLAILGQLIDIGKKIDRSHDDSANDEDSDVIVQEPLTMGGSAVAGGWEPWGGPN